MRIILLQDAPHLPTFGGGNKANRLLLAEFSARGFTCRAISRASGGQRPLSHEFDSGGLAARGVSVGMDGRYRHQGVDVVPLDFTRPGAAVEIEARISEFAPDWILVSDDRPALLLDIALRYSAERTIAIVHTHMHLPFGPEAVRQDPAQHERLRQARNVIAVSEYSRAHLRRHGQIESTLLHFPVFGSGPFAPPTIGGPAMVAMINPCLAKGLPIFLALAERFPETRFLVVPTWGADPSILDTITQRPNVIVRAPADDIGTVLAGIGVLLAPSLMPETFGYVAIDAMLRGIPVLAGNLGGQPEAKLGIDYVLPVTPLGQDEPQPIETWYTALNSLLSDRVAYRHLSEQSRDAAHRFLPQTDARHFIRHLERLTTHSHGVRQKGSSPAAPG